MDTYGGNEMREYPLSYIQYLAHFHGDRDYFECHEILEEYWKATDTGNKKSIWVAFIQLAVSNYHYRRNNFSGAKRTLRKAYEIFADNKNHVKRLGIDDEALIKSLAVRESQLQGNLPYTSFNLPLADCRLFQLSLAECKEKGFEWGAISNPNNLDLIHKHSLRDRTDIILGRKIALEERRKKKEGSED